MSTPPPDPGLLTSAWLDVLERAFATGEAEVPLGPNRPERARLRVETEGAGATRAGLPVELAAEVMDALRFPDDRFHMLAEASSEGILVHEDGVVLSVNRQLAELLGYSPEEMIGMNGMLLAAPEDRDRLQRNIAARVEEPYSGNAQRKDGTRVPVELRASTVWFRGRPLRVVALRDISIRKRAEDALVFMAEAGRRLGTSLDYRATLDSVADLVVPDRADVCVVQLLRPDGSFDPVVVRHSDPEMQPVLEELTTRYSASLSQPRSVAAVAVQSGRPVFLPDIPVEHLKECVADEYHLGLIHRLSLCSHVTLPLQPRGRPIGAVSFSLAASGRRYDEHDLTLMRDLAKRIGTAIDHSILYREAQEANRAKSDFLAIVSHELRTPLTSIIMFADLLASEPDAPLSPAQREQVAVLTDGAWHLATLVDGILEFTQRGTDAPRLVVEDVDIGALISAVAAQMRPLADQRSLPVRVVRRCTPPPLRTDAHKIRQILINLLSNAIAFTEAGSITVTLTCTRSEARIAVRDTGRGIDAEHLERIFDAFWQAEPATTRVVGGAGLGLSIARRLSQLLEGRIEVESRPGKGSTFTLVLPLRTVTKGAEPRPDAAP